ncbi:MAG: hypothetical protein K1060chlam1_00217, partial [Candidatus Anoxychlamydiales bacterium]|nr:hypothetical protein [Candidatus Anoxychlamydiales bacterium]
MNRSNFAINKTKIFFKMKSFFILFFLNFLFIHTIFSDLTWQLPAQDVGPSDDDTTSYDIATNASGSNVYFVWATNLATTLIQTTTSNDFGVTFNTTPITISSEIGSLPQIVTDYSGKYVYISYQFDPGANQDRVLFSRSIDFGQTYTLGGSQKTLSSPVTANPKITTNTNGQYVYVVWETTAPVVVEFTRSIDFGENWPAPASAITLSDTTSLGNLQIATSDSGQYINVLWSGFKSPATVRQVQTSRSEDFGQTWTAFVDIPNLS